MNWAYPICMVQGFACEAKPEVCSNIPSSYIFTFEGSDLEGVNPDVVFTAGG